MARVRVRSGRLSSRNLQTVTNGDDQDPRTMVGLVYRLTGDPLRALVLVGLSAALAGVFVLLLTLIAPLNVLTAIAGLVSGGAMLIGLILRRAIRSRRR